VQHFGVSITEQDNQAPPKVSVQVALIEIETAHANWVIGSQIGQHVPAAVRCYSDIDGRSASKREIAQYELSAC
jgi:hypothetical protein